MRVSSSAWIEAAPLGVTGRTALVVLLVLMRATSVLAADWYVSDASGIALELTSESRARRLDYGLSIEKVTAALQAPEAVRFAVPVGGAIELRTLYDNGQELRWRWAALDDYGTERYVETHRTDGAVTYERYDATRRFIEEGRFSPDGAGTLTRYFYTGSRLDRAEAFAIPGKVSGGAAEETSEAGRPSAQESPLWVDTYRYLRSGALRSVERVRLAPAVTKDSETAAPALGAAPATTEFAKFEAPRGVPRLLVTRSADGSTFKTRYDTSGRVIERESFDPSGKPMDAARITTQKGAEGAGEESVVRITEEGGVSVETTLDERGRAVLELRTDANGLTISERRTVWKENKIALIETVAGAETRRTEYEYDDKGNRMMERNYRGGILERSVRRSGSEETEELYSDGVPVLRAVWVDGRKVSERRLRRDGASDR